MVKHFWKFRSLRKKWVFGWQVLKKRRSLGDIHKKWVFWWEYLKIEGQKLAPMAHSMIRKCVWDYIPSRIGSRHQLKWSCQLGWNGNLTTGYNHDRMKCPVSVCVKESLVESWGVMINIIRNMVSFFHRWLSLW